ncbi:hypothetical protein GGF46_005292, partial [Coemansia sp. RSA 552]
FPFAPPMLCCKRNQLSSEELAAAEKFMNSYLQEEWGSVGLSFDPWEYSRAEKQGILLAIFKSLNVLTVLELSPSDMLDFCLDMESLYLDVPYHSFNHAVDVVVKLYYMLHDLQASSYLASYDIAALLIAALCHDCAHPGLNNLFQKNAGTSLAQRYPDAILERYSIDLAHECIARHRLFRNVESLRDPVYSDSTVPDVDVASRMRRSIRCAILNTDMSRHFSVVEECKALVAVLAKKARRISVHGPHKRDNSTATLSDADAYTGAFQKHPEQRPESSASAATATQMSSMLSLPRPHMRVRSPSEPVGSKQAFPPLPVCDIQHDDATTATAAALQEGKVAKAQSPNSSRSGSGNADSPPPAAGTSPVQSNTKRLQLRRSISMCDALLDSAQRQSLINILLHAVDVFNPVLPWPMCKKWSDRMNAESFHQGDLEKKLSLPVSPNMDREATDQRQVSLDFGNIIIRPFFTEMVSLFPVDDVLLPQLEKNLQKWSRLSTDTLHEICPPAGANNNMYSWPVEPMNAAPSSSLSSNSSLSGGRRLSVAAGTLDIPPSRLETIRRHSHEGFEALHHCMVGHIFSKHLERIQERRKASYSICDSKHLPVSPSRDRRRPSPLGTAPLTLSAWQGHGTSTLSPVTEATCIEDASAPTTGKTCLDESDTHGKPIDQHHPAPDAGPRQHLDIHASSGPPLPFLAPGPASARLPPGSCSEQGAPMPNNHLSSYCIASPVYSPRLNRSASLDPTLLSNMPTSYPSLVSDGGSGPATSPGFTRDN